MDYIPERVIEFPSQRGNLVVYHCEGPDERFVGIYGDPAGLRSLGELLIVEAELDQSQFPPPEICRTASAITFI
jgi:hypothetical protein